MEEMLNEIIIGYITHHNIVLCTILYILDFETMQCTKLGMGSRVYSVVCYGRYMVVKIDTSNNLCTFEVTINETSKTIENDITF